MTASMHDRTDVHTHVTNRILADLERGVRPWMKPWNAGHAAGDRKSTRLNSSHRT